MNSLKVVYKYLLVVILMMLPIGSLLFKFYNESYSEIRKFEKQSIEVKKYTPWVETLNSDIEKILKQNTSAEDYSQSIENYKTNIYGLKEVYLSSALLLEGNQTGEILSYVSFNLVPDLINILYSLRTMPSDAKKNSYYINSLKDNSSKIWTQFNTIQEKLNQRHPIIAKKFSLNIQDVQNKFNLAFTVLNKKAYENEEATTLLNTHAMLISLWKNTIHEIESETTEKLQEAKKDNLIFTGILCFFLILSFGITLNIFFDMAKRIKKLIEVTKNVDPKKILIQTAMYGDDEIGDLAQSFETMSIELKESFKKILQANEAKSSFVAVISHELRTPINGIIGTTNLFAETPLNEEQKLFINTIKKSSDVLLTLINNILDISKIESGKMTTEMIDFSLNDLLVDIKDCFEFIAQQKNIKLITNSNLSNLYHLKGDMHKIKQIMFNLISNSLKFTHSGEIQISAKLIEESETNCKIHLSVKDQGIGIAPENLGKLFNDFVQTDSSMTRKYGGTGLGLSLSKKFANLMGGNLFVKSQLNLGSEFWLELNFEKVYTSADNNLSYRKQKNLIPQTPIQNNDFKVLIAEDNDVNQMILQKYLKKWGYPYATASNGKEAIQIIENDVDIKLILMDCQMPEIDGLEATKILRKYKEHRIQFIPIVALTANALDEDKQKCIDAGMNSFISKPIDPENLKSVIELYHQSIVKTVA